MRNYGFRRLTRDDLPLMQRWLATPHVRTWWPNAAEQVTLMELDMDNPAIDMHLVELNDHPFAYLHDHDVHAFDMPEFADLPRGSRVLATFVGDEAFQGQGHSVGYIEARTHSLRRDYPLIAAGPNTTDTHAISIYAQARYFKRRLASTRDGRLVQVMTYT